MNKKIIFYITGGLLTLLLVIYVGTLFGTLASKMSVISQTGATDVPPVASFNLEKFKELKINK